MQNPAINDGVDYASMSTMINSLNDQHTNYTTIIDNHKITNMNDNNQMYYNYLQDYIHISQMNHMAQMNRPNLTQQSQQDGISQQHLITAQPTQLCQMKLLLFMLMAKNNIRGIT